MLHIEWKSACVSELVIPNYVSVIKPLKDSLKLSTEEEDLYS